MTKKLCFIKFKLLNGDWILMHEHDQFTELQDCFIRYTDVEIVDFSEMDENTTLFVGFSDWRAFDVILPSLKKQLQHRKFKKIFYDVSGYDLQEVSEDFFLACESLIDVDCGIISGNLLSKRQNHFWFPALMFHYTGVDDVNYSSFESLRNIERTQHQFLRKYKGIYHVGHTRYHKVEMLEFLHQKGYLNDFMWGCTAPDYDLGIIDDLVPRVFKEKFNSFDILKQLPYFHDYQGYDDYNVRGNSFNLVSYLDSYFEIVAETRFYHVTPDMGGGTLHTSKTWGHISEKIMRPTFTGHPFVFLGKPNVLQALENLGLKYRFDFWNHDYDQIEDATQRMVYAQKFVDKIVSMEKRELSEFKKEYNNFTKDNCKVMYFDLLKNATEKMYTEV